MKAVLIVFVVMISFDAFALTVFPEWVKRLVASLSSRELQVVGLVESLIALAVVYYLACGAA